MNTSLALTTNAGALTVTQAPALERTYVIPARSNAELAERVREASASFNDVRRYLRSVSLKDASAVDLKTVNYALARARYRENMDLSIEHVALLAGLTVEKARRYFKRLQIQIGDRVSNQAACKLLTTVADYD